MTIEYLIAIKKGNTLCSDKESLKRYISVSPEITINKDKLTFKGQTLKFTIREKLKADKNHHYFEFCLDFEESISDDLIIELVRLLKSNFIKIDHQNVNIKILWDDLGTRYNVKAYPIINRIENLLRKLISKFMILNVGVDWFSSNTTLNTQQKSRDRGDSDIFYDKVYQLDFIDLSEVLFSPYRTMSIQEVDNLLESLEESTRLSQIKEFYPRSNWERYFSSIVEHDEKKIKKDWTELYGIRNNIAHNRFISKATLLRLEVISQELEPILKNAIRALDKISLSDEEKDAIIFNQSDGRPMRLIVASKKLNQDMKTLVDFLSKKGKEIRLNPNTKISSEDYRTLILQFGNEEMIKRIEIEEKRPKMAHDVFISDDYVEAFTKNQRLLTNLYGDKWDQIQFLRKLMREAKELNPTTLDLFKQIQDLSSFNKNQTE